MPKPIILAVDDDPEVLNAVDRDLRAHFRADYRVIKVGSGRQAVDTTLQLKQRGSPIALFLVDERMPEMSGTQFLAEAKKLYPDARKVLLTAYADTETAILAINRIGLDHYLLKPWEPPTERLYPVLDDLLADWRAKVRPPQDGLRVAGTALSPSSYALKDFLSGNGVPYQWVDLDADPDGARDGRGDAGRAPETSRRAVPRRERDGAAHAARGGRATRHADARQVGTVRLHRDRRGTGGAGARPSTRRPRGCARFSSSATRPEGRPAPARRSRTISGSRAA